MRQAKSPRRATSGAGSRDSAGRKAGRRTLLLLALVSCSVPHPTEPEWPLATPPSTQPVTPSPPVFPALTKPAEVYLAPEGLYASIRNLSSRFALYADGTFALQFSGRGEAFEYRGSYVRDGSVITFEWEGWSTAGPWGATGTVTGDSLAVKYNLIMQMTDFIDGTYVRQSGTQ